MRNLTLIAVAAALLASPAMAQDETQLNEIVVTGSRINRDYNPVPVVVPVVTVPRRADNLIVSIWAVNDTREATGRREELTSTLRSMARAAASQPDIALSIQVDGQLVAFTEDMVSSLTLGIDDDRSDTSTASLIVKTPIRPGDTLDSASARIVRFVARIEKSGRSLVNINGGWQLSIVNPAQYRPVVLDAIAADAAATSARFGPGYAVEVQGMANTLTWVQSGPLDLSLFIPYQMSITPRP